ncbi:MAG: nitrate ABC transporter permease [Acidimicrobiales bacterium]
MTLNTLGTEEETEREIAPGQPQVVAEPTGPAASARPANRGRLPDMARAIGWGLAGGLVMMVLWAVFAARAPDLPTPAEGIGEAYKLLSRPFYDNGPNDKGIGLQLAVSLQRVVGGFGLAALVGIPLGLLIGASRRVGRAANPVVSLLRPVSPLAWFPIWLVVLDDSGKAAVFVIFITALWPVVINTAAGAAAIPLDQRNVARVFRFGRMAYLRHVLVPNSLPSVITGLRLSMGIAWMVIVAVEMLSSGAGIGWFVWESYNAGNLAAVAAAILLIGTVGLVLDGGFRSLSRRVELETVKP